MTQEVSQALQDYMEQQHGIFLSASEWDAVAKEALTAAHTEAAELKARVEALTEQLRKATEPVWFYADGWEEKCLSSPDEAIDLLDFEPGEYVTRVGTARPCPDIWCAVRVTDDEDADERFTFTEHATEELARQALGGVS